MYYTLYAKLKSSNENNIWLYIFCMHFQISGTIFLDINEKKLYSVIEDTEHKAEFVEHLVRVNRMRNIISFAIKHKG